MADFDGFESFSAYVSDAGFVCFKQYDRTIGGEVMVMFPMALWAKVAESIQQDIAGYDGAGGPDAG